MVIFIEKKVLCKLIIQCINMYIHVYAFYFNKWNHAIKFDMQFDSLAKQYLSGKYMYLCISFKWLHSIQLHFIKSFSYDYLNYFLLLVITMMIITFGACILYYVYKIYKYIKTLLIFLKLHQSIYYFYTNFRVGMTEESR